MRRLVSAYQATTIIAEIAARELKEQFSRFALGKWWMILFPVIFMFSVSMLAQIALNVQNKDYPLFLLAGFMFWFFFSNAVHESIQYVLHQYRLSISLQAIRLHYLPAVKVVTNYAIFLAQSLVIIVLLGIKHQQLLFAVNLLIISVYFFFFTVGIAYLLCTAVAFWRDLVYILPYMFMFLFWLTPVMFSLDHIPAQYHGLYRVNPLTPFFVSVQKGIVGNESIVGQFGLLSILSLTAGVLGVSIFYGQRKRMVKALMS